MSHPSPSSWRGEFVPLSELAALMGKSYETIKLMCRSGDLNVPGIRFIRVSRRVWARIDSEVYDSLRVSR